MQLSRKLSQIARIQPPQGFPRPISVNLTPPLMYIVSFDPQGVPACSIVRRSPFLGSGYIRGGRPIFQIWGISPTRPPFAPPSAHGRPSHQPRPRAAPAPPLVDCCGCMPLLGHIIRCLGTANFPDLENWPKTSSVRHAKRPRPPSPSAALRAAAG